MELIVVSGFLGSGKTSILLTLANAFAKQGRSVAIIENEVGENGVDGEELKAEGLNVREIYAGCVCCSLRHDLIHTLLELEREVKPDVVFLEPSGVAGPKQIRQCLYGYGGEIDKQTFLVIADAERLPAIQDFSIPLIRDGLEIADLVAINKSDLVSGTQLRALEERVSALNPEVEVLCVSATGGLHMDQLTEKLVRSISDNKPERSEEKAGDFPEASIFAGTLSVDSPVPGFAGHIKEMLQNLASRLKEKESVLIGHLKAIVKTRPTGYGVYSVTAAGRAATEKGRLPAGPLEQLVVTVNAIAYGMEDEEFKMLCRSHFEPLDALLKED